MAPEVETANEKLKSQRGPEPEAKVSPGLHLAVCVSLEKQIEMISRTHIERISHTQQRQTCLSTDRGLALGRRPDTQRNPPPRDTNGPLSRHRPPRGSGGIWSLCRGRLNRQTLLRVRGPSCRGLSDSRGMWKRQSIRRHASSTTKSAHWNVLQKLICRNQVGAVELSIMRMTLTRGLHCVHGGCMKPANAATTSSLARALLKKVSHKNTNAKSTVSWRSARTRFAVLW